MPEEITDAPLTELERDQLDSGWVHFVCTIESFPNVSDYVNNSRGYPNGATVRGLPLEDDLIVANDDSGRLMLKLATWRVSGEDISALQPFIDDGDVSILTSAEFAALKPEETENL